MRGWRAAGWGVLALAFVAAVVPQLPLRPTFFEPTLDGSFAAVLHHAAAQPQAERPRLISTYGPLGFASYAFYLPATYGRMFAVRIVLATVLCGVLAWVGWATTRSPWGAALVLLASAAILTTSDVRGFLIAALLALVELVPGRPPPTLLRIILGAALGVMAVTKVTFVTAALTVLGPLALAALLVRRVPAAALAAVATIAGLWLAFGLGWSEWVAYLDWSLRDITPGYSQAMQLRTANALVAQAVVVSLALLAWTTILARRTRRPGWWAPPIAFAAVLLLQFKAGFVRADTHVYTTATALLLESVVLTALLGPRPRAVALGVALTAALPAMLIWRTMVVNSAPGVALRFANPRELLARLTVLPPALRGDGFSALYDTHVRDVRGVMAMPAFDGGVDLIGYTQSLLLANQAPYRPRPVFQGYMAYTPRLSRENAAYLSGAAAPRWLLFSPDTIDGRLPAMDDAASWPVLLSGYRVTRDLGRYALLERRDTPRPWRLVPLGDVETQTDRLIAVPAAPGPIWARVVVDETPGERLTTQLFAAPYEYLDLIFTTRAAWRSRLVAAIAADGFLLSPVIKTASQFVALSTQGTPALPEQMVSEIRVHVESPFGTLTAPRRVLVEFARLELGE